MTIDWKTALNMLRAGNERYLSRGEFGGDVSDKARKTAVGGQSPFAAVVTCSDSRVIPEAIFSTGIGDIFVIRNAGNLIDDLEAGSVEYATGHLGIKLVVILGHTHCGAVGAAIGGDAEGHIAEIVERIKAAIGTERDERAASELNARNTAKKAYEICDLSDDVRVIPALYDIETGKAEFFIE